jgi:hypothetical protein
VTLPAKGAPEVRAETGGALLSGLPLQRGRSGARMVGSLAAASPARLLLVSSGRGTVRIEREE